MVQWAHPLQRMRTPTHGFWPSKITQNSLQCIFQPIFYFAAFSCDAGKIDCIFTYLALIALIQRGKVRLDLRKPSSAACGASTRGPFLSVVMSGCKAGRLVTEIARWRAETSGSDGTMRHLRGTQRFHKTLFQLCCCILLHVAGISSEKHSNNSVAMTTYISCVNSPVAYFLVAHDDSSSS